MLYLGGDTAATAQYGFRLQPSWNITGPRVDMVIAEDQYFDVPDIISGANWGPITASRVPWMEFRSFDLQYGGWVVFHVVKNVLQRSILAGDLKIAKYTDTIMDLENSFITTGAVKDKDGSLMIMYNITKVFETDYVAKGSIDPYWIYVELINEPADWYVDEYDYQLRDIDGSFGNETISFGMVLKLSLIHI